MNTLVIIFSILSAICAASNLPNPQVLEPKNMTYNAGMTIPIKWSGAKTGFVNIDVINVYRDVLSRPVTIASGVPADKGIFQWKIPSILKTAVGYKIRVWGAYQPEKSDLEGVSQMFTVFNDIPDAVNNFIVLTPNSKKPCAVNYPCMITWDYPETIDPPNQVHLGLYRVGDSKPAYKIATVNAAEKSFKWQVPNDPTLLQGNVFIAVDGSGVAPAGPKMASSMGANSQAFSITEKPIKTAEEIKAEKEAAEKAKKDAEEKKAMEEEKKKNEALEKKKREEEQKALRKKEQEKNKQQPKPAGRVNKQAENSAFGMRSSTITLYCGMMVAIAAFIF